MENEKLKIEEIKVIREFEILLPKNTEIVKEQLEKSILNFGVKDPLIITKIDNQNILIDGHHRFEIIKKHNLDFNCVFLDFKTKEEVKEWMIKNQINKRNLSKAQNMFVIGLFYQSKIKDRTNNFNGEQTGNTAAEVAKIFNISESSVKNYADYAKLLSKFDEDYKNSFLTNNETRTEIIQNIYDNYYFVLCSQTTRMVSEPIEKVIKEAEQNVKNEKEKTKNEIAAEYKPKPKITENKIFQKTSQKPNATKSQNLTFAEQQPKQNVNSNLSNVKTYTELDIEGLKAKLEYYKDLAQKNEDVIEHLRQQQKTGFKHKDKQKIVNAGFKIIKREEKNIFAYNKDLSVKFVKAGQTEEIAKKEVLEMLKDEKTICELY